MLIVVGTITCAVESQCTQFAYPNAKLILCSMKHICLVQVGMILAVEAGVFPLMCGWWIDICSFVS